MTMGREAGVDAEGPTLTRFFAVVAALIHVVTPLRTDAIITVSHYKTQQLNALQSLWQEWKVSTPDLANNLAGWNSTQKYPCWGGLGGQPPNWRGVQCLTNVNCNGTVAGEEEECDAYIIGLTLNNASLVGRLPPAIGNINTLSTLELTGNPNLTGPLPQEIEDPFLHILDLHDNGLNGSLPTMDFLYTLLEVDFSGNRFDGKFFPQIRKWILLQSLKLARNQFSGSLPSDAFVNMTQLETLDLSENQLSGALPDFTNCTSLQSLILSNNSWKGSLPDLTHFTSLRTLKLAYNNLNGEFPFASFINASVVNSSLSVLDVSGNQLTGSVTNWNNSDDLIALEELHIDNTSIGGILDLTKLIESGLVRTNSGKHENGLRVLSMMKNDITDVRYEGSLVDIATVIRLQGNPYCSKNANDANARCFCEQYCTDRGGVSNKKVITIAAAASAASVLVIIAVIAAALLYRARRYKRYLLFQVSKKFEEYDVKPTIFSYSELKAATRDFHPDTKLGEGGYGAVYKGTLPNQSIVAVKQLLVKNTQGMDNFLNEVVLITGMKHRNLVNLKGCCLREHQRLLVYEYVDNYDIDQILLRGEHKRSLSWPERYNICLGVARGLHYLHSLAHPKIIHRDIKASNILLDKNLEPKIADFGLALLFPDEQSHIMTVHVAGTKGYLAPEYASLGQLSEKVDVYSFGILCLEILCGRRNIDETLPIDEIYLSTWAWKLHAGGNVMDLVDKSMRLLEDEKREVRRMVNIALLCAQVGPEQRPTMARVVAMLQHDTESEVLVLNSGKKERIVGLTTVSEMEEGAAGSSTRNPPAAGANRGSLRRDGSDGITVEDVLELSVMRAR